MAAFLISAAADFIITYIGTPDLKHESNPIVSVYGFGWGAMLTANLVIFVMYAVLAYYTFIRFERSVIQCGGFRQYYSILCFGRPGSFMRTLYKMPSNKDYWRYMMACTGYIFTVLFPVFRLIAIIEWIGIITNSHIARIYFDFLGSLRFITPLGRFDMLLTGALSVLVLCVYWFYREYAVNKKSIRSGTKTGGAA